MKKLLLVFTFLNSFSLAFSQEIHTIRLDFEKNCFYPEDINALNTLKKGDLYQLKVENINMNLYKVVFNKKDTIIVSNLTFPTFDLVSLGGITDLLAKINFETLSTISLPSTILSVDIQNKINNQGQYLLTDSEFDYLMSELKSKNLLNSNNLKVIIKSRILKDKDELIIKSQVAKNYKQDIDSLSLTIQKKIFSYLVLDKNMPYYNLLSGNIDFDNVLLSAESIRARLKILSEEIKKEQSNYTKFISADNIKKFISEDNELREADKALMETFTKLISDVDKLYESINSEKVASWIKELIFKENNSSSTYTSLPQQLNGDQTKLNIQFVPIKEEYALPFYQTEIQFPQRKRFYVGVGMSFYYTGFKNESYSTEATILNDSTTNYQIVDEKHKKGELGLTTLIHFGWKPCYYDKNKDWFAVNLVMGPALSITKAIRPRVVVGGGLAFGRKNMLTINGLFTGGYVDKKSEVYRTKTVYNNKPENITVSKLEGAVGISLGYIYKF
jgi:hypothetical protein